MEIVSSTTVSTAVPPALLAFPKNLELELMRDARGLPLRNRSGHQLYRLTAEFIYVCILTGATYTVPAGFVTDFASIPQALSNIFGDIAQEPAVIHDYLYSTGIVAREIADKILKEACTVTEEKAWKIALIYAGVRVGGAGHFNSDYTT